MAYVINPDGTIRVVDVEYDSAGNMRLKRTYGEEDSYVDNKKKPAARYGRPIEVGTYSKKRKTPEVKQSAIREKDDYVIKEDGNHTFSKKMVEEKDAHGKNSSAVFSSAKDIDLFFWDLIEKGKLIDIAMRFRLVASMKAELKDYFNERCDFYEVYMSSSNEAKELCKLSFHDKVKSFLPKKKISDTPSKCPNVEEYIQDPQPHPYFFNKEEIDLFFWTRIRKNQSVDSFLRVRILASLSDVELKRYFNERLEFFDWYGGASKATRKYYRTFFEKKALRARQKSRGTYEPAIIMESPKKKRKKSSDRMTGNAPKNNSCTGKRTPDNGYIYGRSVNGASRQPKYGYARDRYGRIQERDHYNEDRHNEFKRAQNNQRNYDYSDYDSNDDHDGAYNGWD